MSDTPPLVICLGHVVADHTFWVESIPRPPSKTQVKGYALGAGGMAANAAIAVVRLGGRALFWSRVGDDVNRTTLEAALAAEGVDTHELGVTPGARTPVSAVLVDAAGERSILTFRGEGLDPDPSWITMDELDEARALLCDPRWPEGADRALREARARGVPSVLDGETSEPAVLHHLVPLVDHAIFSAGGLERWAEGVPAEAALRRAVEAGCTLAAVTRGEEGTTWLTRDDPAPRHLPAVPVRATNTSGAGDVFHGAYALALAEGQAIEPALRLANAAGALRARDGETPRRDALEALLRDG